MSQASADEKWFWIQSIKGQSLAREGLKVMVHAHQIGYKAGWGLQHRCPTKDFIPVGDVDFCETQLGYKVKPNFAPEWSKDFWHRNIKIELIEGERKAIGDCFAKSAAYYKLFPPILVKKEDVLPTGLLLISDVVKFVQEWRYYVTNGEVVTTGWYEGYDEDEPAPKLDLEFPRGYCGAVDFGRLDNGKIALVEAHHPFACGWYGDDNVAFVQWLADGWEYVKNESTRN